MEGLHGCPVLPENLLCSLTVSLCFNVVPCPLIICSLSSGSRGWSSSWPASYVVVRSLLKRMWSLHVASLQSFPFVPLAQMFHVALDSIFFLSVITLFARASATCGNSVLPASFGDLFSLKPQAVQWFTTLGTSL